MPVGRLSALQERVLVRLAGIDPPWTLTGGGALAGFHTQHRKTRDLDLFFRAQRSLGEVVDRARDQLEQDGLGVTVLRTSAAFSQLEVRDAADSVIVDLVADPTPIAEPPRTTPLGGVTILVDTPHQLLVNKLCALLSRSELRDLVDVRELLTRGGDLRRGLQDSLVKTGGSRRSRSAGRCARSRLIGSRTRWAGPRPRSTSSFGSVTSWSSASLQNQSRPNRPTLIRSSDTARSRACR